MITLRRILTWTATPAGVGAALLVGKTYPGGWGVAALVAVAGAVISTIAALLPQESEHRRDVWRAWFHHREQMAYLRLAAAEARSGSTRRADDHEPSG
ncbi:hypothetical protein [Streptomyces shenzhenensis]|uniref:hypothetical protein n=1 Tax=Streptomyces shenzhenensis TaxID=943815 RepID=UPI00340A9825